MHGITILSATLTHQWVVGFFADKIIVPENIVRKYYVWSLRIISFNFIMFMHAQQGDGHFSVDRQLLEK